MSLGARITWDHQLGDRMTMNYGAARSSVQEKLFGAAFVLGISMIAPSSITAQDSAVAAKDRMPKAEPSNVINMSFSVLPTHTDKQMCEVAQERFVSHLQNYLSSSSKATRSKNKKIDSTATDSAATLKADSAAAAVRAAVRAERENRPAKGTRIVMTADDGKSRTIDC